MARSDDLAQIALRSPGPLGLRKIGLVAFCGFVLVSDGARGALRTTEVAGEAAGQLAATTSALADERVLPWPMDQVWPTAVRYLRVDRGYAIVDKDADSGFILFEFAVGSQPDRTGRGSLELYSATDSSGRPSVHAKVGTDAGPVHLGHSILQGLADKLLAERGQPPPPPPKKPKDKPGKAPPDGEPPAEPDPDGDDLTLE